MTALGLPSRRAATSISRAVRKPFRVRRALEFADEGAEGKRRSTSIVLSAPSGDDELQCRKDHEHRADDGERNAVAV